VTINAGIPNPRYIHIYSNKWLDRKADKLFSDGIDEKLYKRTHQIYIIHGKHPYPEEYHDAYYRGNVIKRDDMKNDSLFNGFHRIVISETNPNGDVMVSTVAKS